MKFDRDGFSVEAAKRKKRPLPEWYLAEPQLPSGLQFFMNAYHDLATCRPWDGGNPLPIPWTACALYADRKGLEADLADLLWDAVRAADQADRKWIIDHQKATIPKSH